MKKITDLLMRDPVLGMIAGGVGGQIMGALNAQRQYNQNVKNTALQVKAQKELTEFNKEQQLDLWERTGYGAQVKQMKDANVNPALLYGMKGGGGQTANVATGNVGMGSSPSAGGEGMGMVENALAARMQDAQIENLEADTELKKADANKTAGVDTEESKSRIELNKAGVTEKGALTEMARAETILKRLEGEVQGETLDARIDRIEYETEQALTSLNRAKQQQYIEKSTMEDNIKKIKAEAVGAVLNNALTIAETQNTKADTNLKKQQTTESQERVTQIKSEIKKWSFEMAVEAAKLKNENRKITQEDLRLKIEKFKADLQEKFNKELIDRMEWNNIINGAGKILSAESSGPTFWR